MRNYIRDTLMLVVCVVVLLAIMRLLPDMSFGGHPLRRVDIFSSIRVSPEDSLLLDSLNLPKLEPFMDTCKSGVTCIEDYSDSLQRGMQRFYSALNKMDSVGDTPVRIAVLGDSFIEGDVLIADLRALFQSRYGGSGVGYVSMTSAVSGFRPTVRHSYRGWYSHCVTDSSGFDRRKQDLSGRYFTPTAGAYVELRGVKYLPNLDSSAVSKFYFINRGYMRVTAQINDENPISFEPMASSEMQALTLIGKLQKVRWSVDRSDSAICYGITMEGRGGLVLDNFSIRGSSGVAISGMSESVLKDMNRLRPYDLVILMYGLNVASPRGVNYDYYLKGMSKAIENLKRCFPESAFLLVGVGDRDYKTETGEFKTMPGILNLIRYQQQIAADCKIAFWNMYRAMGGESSISNMVHAKPSMANYDYTHINFLGGRYIARELFEALLYGNEQYKQRMLYESKYLSR